MFLRQNFTFYQYFFKVVNWTNSYYFSHCNIDIWSKSMLKSKNFGKEWLKWGVFLGQKLVFVQKGYIFFIFFNLLKFHNFYHKNTNKSSKSMLKNREKKNLLKTIDQNGDFLDNQYFHHREINVSCKTVLLYTNPKRLY